MERLLFGITEVMVVPELHHQLLEHQLLTQAVAVDQQEIFCHQIAQQVQAAQAVAALAVLRISA
jgi:hypothetical protein